MQDWLKGVEGREITCIEDDESSYIYLTTLENFSEIDSMQTPEKPQILSSLLNYTIKTIYQFKPECSNCSSNISDSMPHLHSWTYTLIPGSEDVFEKQVMAKAKATSSCVRVWKLLFGSELPKYVIVTFAANKEALSKQVKELKFIEPSYSEIVRRKRERNAIIRPDLSTGLRPEKSS